MFCANVHQAEGGSSSSTCSQEDLETIRSNIIANHFMQRRRAQERGIKLSKKALLVCCIDSVCITFAHVAFSLYFERYNTIAVSHALQTNPKLIRRKQSECVPQFRKLPCLKWGIGTTRLWLGKVKNSLLRWEYDPMFRHCLQEWMVVVWTKKFISSKARIFEPTM